MYVHQGFGVENLIECGYLEWIKQRKLIRKENVNAVYYENRTALHIAIIANQVQIAEWLRQEFQPDLGLQDSLGLTSLHWLYIKTHYHHNPSFASLLKKALCQLNSTNDCQFHMKQLSQKVVTILANSQEKLNICLAAQLTIDLLSKQFNTILNNKNNKNTKSIYQRTHFNRKAHHWAAISGNVECFEALMEHKFDPYQQDGFGFNCYHYILTNGNNPLNRLIQQQNMNVDSLITNTNYNPLPNHHDVIIIGSGAAGIGAAITLSRAGLPFIILQARERIGGRINSKQVNEIQMDLGACWVHSCSKNNPVWKEAKKLNWKTKHTPVFTDSIILSQLLHKNQQLPQKDIEHAMILSQSYFAHVQHYAFTSKEDISIEQAGRQFYKSNIATQNATKRSLVDMFISMTESYNAVGIEKLSAKYFEEQEDVGENWSPQGGYAKLMRSIAESVEMEKRVVFGTEVKQIIYESQEESQYCEIITTNGQKYYAKRIISSLPLGILKSNKVKFTPPLPLEHQECIQKLGWGVMNKVIVSFQSPFWKDNPILFRIACEQKGKFPITFNFSTEDKHILCFLITGKFAKKMSPQTDEQILTSLLQVLNKISDTKQEIKVLDYTITRWDQDPYSLGSYSHFGVGANIKTTRSLRKAINNKLWIVGEHCYGEHIGCAHGAFQTGIWAAQQILAQIKTVNIDKNNQNEHFLS